MKHSLILALVLVAGCVSKPVAKPEATAKPIDEHWMVENATEHNHDVMTCYMARLKKKPKLQGDLQLDFSVSPAGEMKDAKIVRSADPEVDACVMAASKAWKYPWNVRGTTYDQAMTDHFRLYMEAGQPRTSFEESQVGMDKEAIRKVVKDHAKDIDGCYRAQLREKPNLMGKVVLDWEIYDNGFAHDVHVQKSVDPNLDKCLVDRLKSWQFPIPPKGMIGRVDFPFVFTAE